MATQAEICRGALALLGGTRINDINETSEEAQRCADLFPIIYRDTLSRATWNFALNLQELVVPVGVFARPDYKNVFRLPTDCFKLVEVLEGGDFDIVANNIYTDADTCTVKYITEQLDTSRWTPSFTQLMVYRLAAELAYVITKSDSRAQTLEAKAAAQMKVARANDSAETPAGSYLLDTLITTRYQ